MANKLVQLMDGNDKVYPQIDSFRSGSSWNALGLQADYAAALNNLDISGFSSGVSTGAISAAGPMIAYIVYKLRNEYYGGLLFGYRPQMLCQFIYQDGHYYARQF